MNSLEEIFKRQAAFQQTLGIDLDDLSVPERVEYAKMYILAAEDELHEALNETSWKPWAEGTWFNDEQFRRELVDVLCFFVNLCLLAGMNADDLAVRHAAKVKVNYARQAVGYTNKAKCPLCEMETGTCECQPLLL